MYSKTKTRVIRCIFILLLIALQAAIIVLSIKMGGKTIRFSGFVLEVNNIMGCLTTIQLMLCVAMTANEWKVGGRFAYLFIVVALSSVCKSVFQMKNVNSLPGLLMLVGGVVFVTVLRGRLKLIDANNKFYQNISITDSLTGLMNRRGMREFAGGLIQDKTPFYMLFIDLDNFKYINDAIGHKVGDTVLNTVAKRCSEINNLNGLVSRNGGDEFIIIVPEAAGLDIEEKAFEYLEVIGKDIWIEQAHMHYTITASIGISHYPEHSMELDDIINYADTAMYAAKNAGKSRIRKFDISMAEKSIHDKHMEQIIEEGIDSKRFFLMYQPQFMTKTQELRGFEALLRLRAEDGSIVSPVEFIPVAEQSDLILEIDKYVLRRAMMEFAEVAKSHKNKFVISINISAKHISDKTFPNVVREILEQTDYPPESLEIEITEYCMVRDTVAATYTIKELNKMGIAIALDDFGTGYASLSNLTKLPIDLIKIDKSFVDNLSMNKTNNEFVEAIISMGHLMHCDIISEGVETAEQLQILTDSQCDFVQGYIWSKPLTYESALEIVNEKFGTEDELVR